MYEPLVVVDIDDTFSDQPGVADWAQGYFGVNTEAVLLLRQLVCTMGAYPVYITSRIKPSRQFITEMFDLAGMPAGNLVTANGNAPWAELDPAGITKVLLDTVVSQYGVPEFALTFHDDLANAVEDLATSDLMSRPFVLHAPEVALATSREEA